eukprot:CAMPEP_0179140854 /NCGR_PEP_ID=MMETSP0796-20121207/67493_1 /TAXON_ID=73915 /ORGANISM="Pyrodinium bahamense, Strain pbaha01" /LENGTH=49 /DNA_ID=CAMNT_0020840475 /DNA_START=68 /DNA_END=217 /DNA_ORIENTATION=-
MKPLRCTHACPLWLRMHAVRDSAGATVGTGGHLNSPGGSFGGAATARKA